MSRKCRVEFGPEETFRTKLETPVSMYDGYKGGMAQVDKFRNGDVIEYIHGGSSNLLLKEFPSLE